MLTLADSSYTALLLIAGSFAGVCSLSTLPPTECYTTAPGLPSSCRDQYAAIPGHLNCIPLGTYHYRQENPNFGISIEAMHNALRGSVSPPAANMLNFNYNPSLERSATIWARQCKLRRNDKASIFTSGSFFLGENILISSTKQTWDQVINRWAAENASFVYNSTGNNQTLVRNYTQMIWAETNTVGCGMFDCNGTYFYVCHYAPSIDESNINTPYIESNMSCASCSHNCTRNLCECSGIICLNGAKRNFDTCKCDCLTGANKHMYKGDECTLTCQHAGDDVRCNGTHYTKDKCLIDHDTTFHCPWMCNVCPYAGGQYIQGSVSLPQNRGKQECTTTSTHTGKPTDKQTTPSTNQPTTNLSLVVTSHPKGKPTDKQTTLTTNQPTTKFNLVVTSHPKLKPQKGGCYFYYPSVFVYVITLATYLYC